MPGTAAIQIKGQDIFITRERLYDWFPYAGEEGQRDCWLWFCWYWQGEDGDEKAYRETIGYIGARTLRELIESVIKETGEEWLRGMF